MLSCSTAVPGLPEVPWDVFLSPYYLSIAENWDFWKSRDVVEHAYTPSLTTVRTRRMRRLDYYEKPSNEVTKREESSRWLCLKPHSSHLGLFLWKQLDERQKECFSGCGNSTLLDTNRVLQELVLSATVDRTSHLNWGFTFGLNIKEDVSSSSLLPGKSFTVINLILDFTNWFSFKLALLSSSWLDEKALKYRNEEFCWKFAQYIQCWCP